MNPEPSNVPSHDPGKSRREVSVSGSLTASGNGATSTLQEEKDPLSSLSQKSSPRLPSILVSPSESGEVKPLSSEDKIPSLILPEDTRTRPRTPSHRGPFSHSKRRGGVSRVKTEPEIKGMGKGAEERADGLLNFGLGDDFALGPEDSDVLADVQRALKAKALRESRSQLPLDTAEPFSDIQRPPAVATTLPPRLPISASTPAKVPFPASTKVPFLSHGSYSSRSLESISSGGPSRRSPVPVLVSLPDGSSYLDWSGVPLEDMPPLRKDRGILGRTFSITRRKDKGKLLRSGRRSVDLGASQGDLHTAHLDNIRRNARRETSSRAEIVKDDLGRRYGLQGQRDAAGRPIPNVLDVVRSIPDGARALPPWINWARRRTVNRQKWSNWTITANSIDEYLRQTEVSVVQQSSTAPPSNLPPHSPSHAVCSPLSSYSSININSSPGEGLRGANGSSPSHGVLKSVKSENNSLTKRVRLSLSEERVAPALESRTSTLLSIANQQNHAQATGPSTQSSRFHSGVSSIIGKVWHNVGENVEKRNVLPRSSMSDERDSGRDGEKGLGKLEDRHTRSYLSVRPGKDVLSTSDSDPQSLRGGSLVEISTRNLRKFNTLHVRAPFVGDRTEEGRESFSASEQRQVDALATSGWTSKRGPRRGGASTTQDVGHEKLQEILWKREEEEENAKEVYRVRETMLIDANDHNRRIARLLKAIGTSIREYDAVQSSLSQATGIQYSQIPPEVFDAIIPDPATSLRHGKGWRAVEESHRRFYAQQALLRSYLLNLRPGPGQNRTGLAELIQNTNELWRNLSTKGKEIEKKCDMVEPAIMSSITHMEQLQKEYNSTQILVETDFPELLRIADLETIISESRSPRGWLEFAAFWIPELVFEFIGGFIRFFGVPISEKFIRPFLWYFFRNRYYWKVYSTEPPPNERTWYTRLAYWIIILSVLAWYATAA